MSGYPREKVNEKKLKNSVLSVVAGGRKFNLAKCDAVLEVYEKEQQIPLAGKGICYTVKSYRAALIICSGINPEVEREIDVEFLKEISEFGISFEMLEVEREQCKFYVRGFQNITPVEINLNGEWRFDVTEYIDRIKLLFPELSFG